MIDIYEIQINQIRGHWEVYIDGEFFCSADNYVEAVNELYETYKYLKGENL